jgi:hypothetical protein
MTHWFGKNLLLLCCLIALAGCAAATGPAVDADSVVLQSNNGYSVLYKLMSDESNVDKILIIKHADEPLAGLVREVAQFCQSNKTQLDELRKRDPRLNFEMSALPAIELRARKLEADEQTRALLGGGGKEFELRLTFTQVQAMDYCQKLTQALAEHEQDASRKTFLTNTSQRSGEFRDTLMGLMTVKS